MRSKSQYQFTLQGTDVDELYRYAQLLEGRMRALPSLQDVASDLQNSNPQLDLVIDRDKASALGLSAGQIEDALYSAYGVRQVSTIFGQANQYRVVLEADQPWQRDPASLSRLRVPGANGQVPLTAIAAIQRRTAVLV